MTRTMTCAYCGVRRPWYSKAWWPHLIEAICWPCQIRLRGYYKPEPRWWSWLARRVRVDWSS